MGPDADDRKERIKKYDGRAENWRKFEANIRAWMRTKHFEISKCLFPLPNAATFRQPTSALNDTSDDEGPPTPRDKEAQNLQQIATPTTVAEAREMINDLRKNAGADHARFADEFDNVKLLALLHQNVETNFQDLLESENAINDCEDGWAAWHLLRLTAHGEMSTRATQIRRQLREKTWSPKTPIADFVTDFNLLIKQLEGCGEGTSQQARIDQLSQAMPPGHAAWETFLADHTLDAIKGQKNPEYEKLSGDLVQYVEAVASKATSRRRLPSICSTRTGRQ